MPRSISNDSFACTPVTEALVRITCAASSDMFSRVYVKGKAGSPYAIKDYYDIDPDLAVDVDKRMEEFEAMAERVHKAGLKLIIDFVPNHVARQYKSDAKPKRTADLGSKDDCTKADISDDIINTIFPDENS